MCVYKKGEQLQEDLITDKFTLIVVVLAIMEAKLAEKLAP